MTGPPKFVEREPYEKGFAEIFEREIVPKLHDAEQNRLELLRQIKQRIIVALIALAGIVVAAVFLIFLGLPWNYSVLLVLAAGYFGWTWASSPRKKHQSELRGIIVGPACHFLGNLEYTREPGKRFDYKLFGDLGVIGSYQSASVEDLFVGHHRDTGFKMVEGRFTKGSRSGTTTVFDGLLFEIEVPITFAGRILIGRDHGRLGNALAGVFKGTTRGVERVTFDHPEFEKRYAAYSDDPAEARQVMAPAFLDTMVALADTYKEKSLGAAFADGVFLLAVPVKGDLFEPGSVRQSVYDCEEDIHEFLKDVTIAHNVIDFLHGDRLGQAPRR